MSCFIIPRRNRRTRLSDTCQTLTITKTMMKKANQNIKTYRFSPELQHKPVDQWLASPWGRVLQNSPDTSLLDYGFHQYHESASCNVILPSKRLFARASERAPKPKALGERYSLPEEAEWLGLPATQRTEGGFFEQAQLFHDNRFLFAPVVVIDKKLLRRSLALDNIKNCGKYCTTIGCENRCYKISIRHSCCNRYCNQPHCIDHRIHQNTHSFDKYKYLPDRLYCITFGSNKLSVAELRKALTLFMNTMRRGEKRNSYQGYQMRYFACLDFSFKHNTSDEKPYIHFHIALAGEKFDNREFIARARIVLKRIHPALNFSQSGWTDKASVLSYMSKRMSGKFGHEEKGYHYFPDHMSFDDYYALVGDRRSFSSSKNWTIINPHVSSLRDFLCPVCGSPLVYFYTDPWNQDSSPQSSPSIPEP